MHEMHHKNLPILDLGQKCNTVLIWRDDFILSAFLPGHNLISVDADVIYLCFILMPQLFALTAMI